MTSHFDSDELRHRKEGLGRDRSAFFIWKGQQSSLNEQGVSALLTTQLEKASSPQVILSSRSLT